MIRDLYENLAREIAKEDRSLQGYCGLEYEPLTWDPTDDMDEAEWDSAAHVLRCCHKELDTQIAALEALRDLVIQAYGVARAGVTAGRPR